MRSSIRAHRLRPLAVLATFAFAASTGAASGDDELARAVVLFLNHTEAGHNLPVGSGFLVRKDDQVVLVTADHVTQGLFANWRLAMAGRDGKAVTLMPTNVNWKHADEADVAVTRLTVENEALRSDLLERAFPAAYLDARPLPPDKKVSLLSLGFPLGLFEEERFGPLSMETKAASGILRQPRFDNGEPADFIFLQQPSIGGLSGGPVLDTGQSYFLTESELVERSGVSIVGLMHGTASDASGGKLAAVVPATEITKLLDAVVAQ